jgi:two-component system, response regulator PdtaR
MAIKSTPHSVLLVDDDRLILSTTSTGLKAAGYVVNTVETVDEAELWLDENERPDLVLLDMRMPKREGLELSRKLNMMNNIPFILLTAYSEMDIVTQAKSCGAMSYLVKPIDLRQLVPAVETAISRAEELQALRFARHNLQIALDSDRSISVAVGIVMNQLNLNHGEAFEALRKVARSNHLKLSDVAASVINARETLNLSFKAAHQ